MTCTKALKWWLIGMLFFIPFQRNIVKSIMDWNADLAIFINRIDEITLIVFIPLAIIEFYKSRKSANAILIILLTFIIFIFAGLISGIVNGNSLYVTALGIFDYIKTFLFIFVYAAFFREFSMFEKLFRSLLIVAVVLGSIALIQELWALSYRYILGKDIQDAGMYILRSVPKDIELVESFWRLGIYRTPSLVGHYNLLGFYSLFILTIYLSISKKVNYLVFCALSAGIIFSMSRMILLGFAISVGIQIFKGRKRLLYLMIPLAIALFYMSTLWDFNVWKFSNVSDSTKFNVMTEDRELPELVDAISYRGYTLDKSIEVWKDYPLWGVGPGMFGGTVSVIMNSPIYNMYNFVATSNLQEWYGIDQFWPQVMAEMGIAGLTCFAGILFSLMSICFILMQQSTSYDMKKLLMGLAIFTFIIVSWGFGGDFKNAVIFTYCAFVGMTLGSISRQIYIVNQI
jgi:hypothetical protein